MSGSEVSWSTAVEQASWIGPRLSPFGADRVDSVIPSGFAAYARLPHPAWRNQGEQMVRWAEVAAWSGVPLDRQAQFHDIALPPQAPAEPAPWDSRGPEPGTLPAHDAAVLVELLAAHTGAGRRLWFCLWDGYGWDDGVATTAMRGDVPTAGALPAGAAGLPDPIPDWVRSGPRVRLPARDYLLSTGSFGGAPAFIHSGGRAPNLWWPEDRSWCVASEIDLPWTYVAGSISLVDAVLTEPRLEALPALPDDPIQFRLRGWLGALVENATDQLLEHGTVTVTTWRGTVHADLDRPTRGHRGWIRTRSQAVNGSGASSHTPLAHRSPDALHGELRADLSSAVTSLVDA